MKVARPADFDFSGSFGALLAVSGLEWGDPGPPSIIAEAHEAGALVAVVTDLLALTLLASPGSQGADIAVGSSQALRGSARLSVAPMPGSSQPGSRWCGRCPAASSASPRTVADGSLFGLRLQTREQHIRREKATSNVCTAQVLLAVIAALYACWHGPEGLAAIARRGQLTSAARLAAVSWRPPTSRSKTETWFDTLTVKVPGRGAEVVRECRAGRHQPAAGRRPTGSGFPSTSSARPRSLMPW